MLDLARQRVLDDGPSRRRLDVSRAAAAFGFRAQTPVDDGLARPVRWDLDERGAGRSG